jgi:hypothetical protein
MKKRLLLILATVALLSLLYGCRAADPPDPKGGSPSEIGTKHFYEFSNDELAEILALKMSNSFDVPPSSVDYIKLLSCKERKNCRNYNVHYELPPDKTFYESSKVDVTFEVKFNKGKDGEFCDSGVYFFVFMMVKNDVQSGWEVLGDPGGIKQLSTLN